MVIVNNLLFSKSFLCIYSGMLNSGQGHSYYFLKNYPPRIPLLGTGRLLILDKVPIRTKLMTSLCQISP